MLRRLLGFPDRTNAAVVDGLYGNIVAAARQPRFYAEWGVPDTPLGRYEMMSLHLFLLLRRLRDETGPARDVAQELTDEFFKDVEHSIRELGIGDAGVPKRMKKLARMFYGRVESYESAMNAGDRAALAAALARNVQPEQADWPHAAAMADHAFAVEAALAAQPLAALMSGKADFVPQASTGEAA